MWYISLKTEEHTDTYFSVLGEPKTSIKPRVALEISS